MRRGGNTPSHAPTRLHSYQLFATFSLKARSGRSAAGCRQTASLSFSAEVKAHVRCDVSSISKGQEVQWSRVTFQ